MDPIDLPRECTISIPPEAETESLYIGSPLKGTIGILPPDDEESPRKFILDKTGNDEYNILIDNQSVDERENGELYLTEPVEGEMKKWTIVMVASPEGDAIQRYTIKGVTYWSTASFPPQTQAPSFNLVMPVDGCSGCPSICLALEIKAA